MLQDVAQPDSSHPPIHDTVDNSRSGLTRQFKDRVQHFYRSNKVNVLAVHVVEQNIALPLVDAAIDCTGSTYDFLRLWSALYINNVSRKRHRGGTHTPISHPSSLL